MNLQDKLKSHHRKLFKQYKIDEKTGCLKDYANLKFPTFPYIGSRYGQSSKILIVGLDIGLGEDKEGIQDFEGRNDSIGKEVVRA